ncbi:MAG TPA: PspC domain-containing protein [Pseudonocardiaceae bacterium]|nr:PspC domain-containing protein [Pseudonocardiaceae bacterium]
MSRRRTGRVVAGVAGGIADHLGVGVLWVRATFVVLAGFAGAGVAAYALLWVFVRQEPAYARPHEVSPRERQQSYALIALGIGLAVTASAVSGTVSSWLAVPLGVALVGAALVWREADEGRRRRWVDGARTGMSGVLLGDGGRGALWRVLTGAALVVTGIGLIVWRSVDFSQIPFALIAVLATLVGVTVLTVPWWLRLVRDLGDERRARIRTEERAEIAAHLHDSVLQTLALIQRQAEAPREVLRLARGQERELRKWLYGPGGYGRAEDGVNGPVTLAEALALACAEVEDTFAVAVRPVVVGDSPLDAALHALAQAAREAMVNAAKHSGEAEVSVYAEVEAEQITIFVRDRGKGFDPGIVSEDRHGIVDSIRGRMSRHGGDVGLRTAVGEGTEVRLTMPRAAGAQPAPTPSAQTQPTRAQPPQETREAT